MHCVWRRIFRKTTDIFKLWFCTDLNGEKKGKAVEMVVLVLALPQGGALYNS